MAIAFKSLALTVTILSFTVTGTADARDWTGGFGYGATYNGLGINVGLKSDESMHYIALGCVDTPQKNLSRPNAFKKENNCGLAVGSLWTINKTCCYGINVGRTSSPTLGQAHLRLSYIHFFRGLKKGGLNVGISPVLLFDSNTGTPEQYLLLNFGMQF